MQTQLQSDFKILADKNIEPTTRFASPERATKEEIETTLAKLTTDSLLKSLMDATGMFIMVLNKQRQIVVASRELAHQLDLDEFASVAGFRPGEAMNCIHAWENAAGCGTAEACSTCGAVLAIVQSQQSGLPVQRDCLMRVRRGEIEEAREFRIKASPLKIHGETYTLIALTDISQEKRRELLENVFFHDILNTISGLRGWSRVLNEAPRPEQKEIATKRIHFLTERLVREIGDQRALIMAEAGALQTQMTPVAPQAILEGIESIFSGHEAARGRSLEVSRNGGSDQIVTDDSLVIRVVANMVKNALEATPVGGTVKVWTRTDALSCEFSVWNAGVIPKPVALQIFRRSFSTKSDKGRGIGTFSMKLFGERYLGGKVLFTTPEPDGTVFTLLLPRK